MLTMSDGCSRILTIQRTRSNDSCDLHVDLEIRHALVWSEQMDEFWSAQRAADPGLGRLWFGSNAGMLRFYPGSFPFLSFPVYNSCFHSIFILYWNYFRILLRFTVFFLFSSFLSNSPDTLLCKLS